MEIRNSREEDLQRILEIYEAARAYMAANGNPNQWGRTHWPPKSLILEDIRTGRGYVVTEGEKIGAAFAFFAGKDIDPSYRKITDGSWHLDAPYGVIHRLGGDGSIPGVADAVFAWALARADGYLRVDTHPDNRIMQRLLAKNGFVRTGIIHVAEDSDARWAYEKIALPDKSG